MDSLLLIYMVGLHISSFTTICFVTLKFQRGHSNPPRPLQHTQSLHVGYRLQDAKYPRLTGAHISALRFFPEPGPITFGCDCFLILWEVGSFFPLSWCFSWFQKEKKAATPLLCHLMDFKIISFSLLSGSNVERLLMKYSLGILFFYRYFVLLHFTY